MNFVSVDQRIEINRRLADSGVIFCDSATCYIDEAVRIGKGTQILPNTVIMGNTVIGENCTIGPNTVISDCNIGNQNEIRASYLTEATVENETTIGPFAYLRPHTHIKNKVKIGDFVEIKNATIGEGTKASHLTYIGDADVGSYCNFGCGSIVVNYDGKHKHRSRIGDHAFIGCNTNLVSPVTIGSHGYTAAGSTVTRDVPEGALAIARARQENKEGWVKERGI